MLRLREKPIQQIWRDHLLAGSHKCVDDFADGLFVFLSPKDNEACNGAVALYRECLSDDQSFQHWTLESVVETFRQATDAPWVDVLYDRYLDFAKVTSQCSG